MACSKKFQQIQIIKFISYRILIEVGIKLVKLYIKLNLKNTSTFSLLTKYNIIIGIAINIRHNANILK